MGNQKEFEIIKLEKEMNKYRNLGIASLCTSGVAFTTLLSLCIFDHDFVFNTALGQNIGVIGAMISILGFSVANRSANTVDYYKHEIFSREYLKK